MINFLAVNIHNIYLKESYQDRYNSAWYLGSEKQIPFENATTDGVVRDPSAFSITLACFPSMTATQEFVVPRSIPITAPLTPSDLLTKQSAHYGNAQLQN